MFLHRLFTVCYGRRGRRNRKGRVGEGRVLGSPLLYNCCNNHLNAQFCVCFKGEEDKRIYILTNCYFCCLFASRVTRGSTGSKVPMCVYVCVHNLLHICSRVVLLIVLIQLLHFIQCSRVANAHCSGCRIFV